MAAQSTTGTLTIAILDSDALAIQAICHNLSRIVPQSSILWHTPVSDLALQRCLSAETAPDVFIVDMVLVDASVIAVCHDIRRATDSIGGLHPSIAHGPSRRPIDPSRPGHRLGLAPAAAEPHLSHHWTGPWVSAPECPYARGRPDVRADHTKSNR